MNAVAHNLSARSVTVDHSGRSTKEMKNLSDIEELKKAHIAHSFLTDAHFFLEKVRVFRQHDANKRTSLIAKLVVDTLMSCECSLKSLFASTSSLSAEDIFKRIKNEFRHDLGKLSDEIPGLPLSSTEGDLLRKYSDAGVSLRYSYDLFTVCDYAELLGVQSDIYMTPKSESELVTIGTKLYDKANQACKQHYPDTSTMLKERGEFQQFVDQLRNI